MNVKIFSKIPSRNMNMKNFLDIFIFITLYVLRLFMYRLKLQDFQGPLCFLIGMLPQPNQLTKMADDGGVISTLYTVS